MRNVVSPPAQDDCWPEYEWIVFHRRNPFVTVLVFKDFSLKSVVHLVFAFLVDPKSYSSVWGTGYLPILIVNFSSTRNLRSSILKHTHTNTHTLNPWMKLFQSLFHQITIDIGTFSLPLDTLAPHLASACWKTRGYAVITTIFRDLKTGARVVVVLLL